MVLHLEGQDVLLAQMGPDFIILKQALQASARPQAASMTLQVDDRVKQIPVNLPQGIPVGQRRVALPMEAEALVAV